MRLWQLTALCAALAGCQPAPARLIFVGNSITRTPPTAEAQWENDFGMAASSVEKDFAHLVSARLKVAQPAIRNFSELEREPVANAHRATEKMAGAEAGVGVVVELGDNAGKLTPEFAAAYRHLLAATNGARVVCVSTYWRKPAIDEMIERECEAHGGRYVFIGDIYPGRKDTGRFPRLGVQLHPHDWSMEQIAMRVVAAF